MKVENLDKLLNTLRQRRKEAADADVSVVVGYTAKYALYVHENREMKHAGEPRPSGLGVYWGPHGRPGFLLDVAREMAGELRTMIRDALRKGAGMLQALLLAGMRLQRESQLNVPVEYGNLKNSAFTRKG